MYFTLAISASSAPACATLTRAALDTDYRVMPIPGPARLAWQSPDDQAALICWGAKSARSHAGTISADSGHTVHAHTGITRTDPVYIAELPGAVVVSDRAAWAAAVTGRLNAPDPVMLAAFLNLGYPVGAVTPFQGVRALGGAKSLQVTAGRLSIRDDFPYYPTDAPSDSAAAGSAVVAAALVIAVTPLADATAAVEVSLTGGKDSRLIAAALTAAKVPFRARTHGAADHPDVVVAATIAARLGIEHIVTEPRLPGTADSADVLARLRSAALVSDGMLSAFENVGRPDPAFAADPIQVGGHGGELLRGGYATYAGNAARGAIQFRRLTTRHLRLLRPAAARAYLASLSAWTAPFVRGPLRALDDFYLVNRAGRWSAAARQAYLLRSELVQPFFDDRLVRAARTVPLRDRVSGQLHRDLLGELCPELLDIPAAGRGPASADWRRAYGDDIAAFLRAYVLDHGSDMFDVVSRRAAENVLRLPHAEHETAWTLATLAALLSGDWLSSRS